jgi:hypothetical protein
MAAFTEAERVSIRRYLGFSRLHTLYNSRLESSITSAQAVADGGSLESDATATLIRATLTSLASVEAKLACVWDQAAALKVDEIEVDPARAMAILRSEGRRLVTTLANALDITPRCDAFGATEPERT